MGAVRLGAADREQWSGGLEPGEAIRRVRCCYDDKLPPQYSSLNPTPDISNYHRIQ